MNFKKSELFKLYFLLMKLFYVYAAFEIVRFAFDLGHFAGSFLAFPALVILSVQFFVAIHAERMIIKKNYIGSLLGLALALIAMPGFSIFISFFGFYALLNKEFRNVYLHVELPVWLSDCLMKLDELTKTA